MRSSKAFGVVAILLVLVVGCSTNSSTPPDTSLTYDIVAQNTAQYEGKRVRWYGQFNMGLAKHKMIGRGSKVNAVFVDPTTDLRVTLRAFAVEAESEKDYDSFNFYLRNKNYWVIGTVSGTRKVRVDVRSPEGEKEVVVPLLRDVQFEEVQGSR